MFVKCFLGKKSQKIWKQHGNFKINSEAKTIHIFTAESQTIRSPNTRFSGKVLAFHTGGPGSIPGQGILEL